MKIAVEGCCHGELDKIYETIAYIESQDNIKVDILLICGDFQSVRNKDDLRCMAVPSKYARMNTFYKYYSGEKKAPLLTIFIGGNHEASNYLQELPYGGWVAPNIYYMGYAGVININGIRIGGISGIFKGRDFNRGHFEHPPYDRDTIRSVYHVRNLEVFRFKQLSQPLDIMLSHDWPRGVYNYGDAEGLVRKKQFFREEVESDTLGSPPLEELLYKLKPAHWFSAHLHVKFAALVQHKPEVEGGTDTKLTKFLALDKCLPKRQFLQICDLPHKRDSPFKLELDPEWLCILKSTDHLLSLKYNPCYLPGPGSSERWDYKVSEEEIKQMKEDFSEDFTLPENFKMIVPVYNALTPKAKCPPPMVMINPQTTLLCEMLNITDPNTLLSGRQGSLDFDLASVPLSDSCQDDQEDDSIDLSDENSDLITSITDTSSLSTDLNTTADDDSFNRSLEETKETNSETQIFSGMNLSSSSSVSEEKWYDKAQPINERECTEESDEKELSSNDETGSPKRCLNQENGNGSDVKKPGVKKFKRRNQAVYAADDNDETS